MSVVFATTNTTRVFGTVVVAPAIENDELELEEIEHSVGIPVVARIKEDSEHVKAIFSRSPASVHNKNSKFSREIAKLSDAIAGQKTKVPFWKKFLSFNMGKEEVNRQVLRDEFYKSMFGEA